MPLLIYPPKYVNATRKLKIYFFITKTADEIVCSNGVEETKKLYFRHTHGMHKPQTAAKTKFDMKGVTV